MKIFKKSIAVFIAALMLVSVMTAANAADAATVTGGQIKVTATSNLASEISAAYDISINKTVTVSYKLTTGLSIVDSEGELTYDSGKLKLKSFTLPNVNNSIVNTEPSNKVKFNNTVGTGDANFAKGADFVVAVFDIVGTGETKVDLRLDELDAEDSSEKLVELATGGKAVSDDFSLSASLSAPKVPALSAKSKKLSAGKTYTITVKNTTGKPTFSSNKKTVATVSKSGKVTALKKGEAKITVKVDGKKLECKIKVTSDPTIKVAGKKFKSKNVYSVKKKGTLSVKIKGKAAAINNKYKTSKKSVAKVTSKTKASVVKIKGLKKGNAKITLTVNKVKKFTIKVKVK